MIRINLLPHREQKRKARTTRFAILAGLSASIGIAIVFVVYVWLGAQVSIQDSRNQFLSDANAKLDKQIAEIETLKTQREHLLDRKKVVERLQANRAESVKIFDQLTRQTPEGVYLTNVVQSNDTVSIQGYAQSESRVSTFMRALADSTVFAHTSPDLIDIRAASAGGQALSEFDLTVKIMRESEDASGKRHGGRKGMH